MDGASQCHQNERCTLLDKLLAIGEALYLCIPGTHGVPLKERINGPISHLPK